MKLRLGQAFFARSARDVARDLVGVRVVHVAAGARREGIVVETEAYLGPTDRACHARFGRTKAREHLFAAPGTSYVFLVYGMHHCFNVTCLGEGEGHAVLIRGVAELRVDGLALAADAGRGPGKAARALAIAMTESGVDTTRSRALYFERVEGPAPAVAVTARVGIAYAGDDARLPLRFLDPTSAGVSRPSARLLGAGDGAPPPRRRKTEPRRP